MTNDELKKKIAEIMSKTWEEPVPCTAERKFERIADALIAAGIGDVKETEHRAEVAERAVYNLAYGEWQREGARLAICEKYAPSTARDYLDRAEKELAKEGER